MASTLPVHVAWETTTYLSKSCWKAGHGSFPPVRHTMNRSIPILSSTSCGSINLLCRRMRTPRYLLFACDPLEMATRSSTGWRTITMTFPRVKYFIWLTFLGRLSTYDFLHFINLGPLNMCIFCNLYPESPEHIFHTCYKSQSVWIIFSNLTGKHILFTNGFTSGDWILHSNYSKGSELLSVMLLGSSGKLIVMQFSII